MQDFITSLGASMPSITITNVDVEPPSVYPVSQSKPGS
jgi:hypothetical protein